MTVDYIYVEGSIDAKNEEIFIYDEFDCRLDVPDVESIKKLLIRIVDTLSEEGVVDMDFKYGHLDIHNYRHYEIEFFVNNKSKGYVTISVKYH